MNTGFDRNALMRGVAPLVAGAVIILVVYALLGELEKTGLQIVATVLLFALPVAYVFGLQTAKAHTRGLEHGVDVKVAAQKSQRKQAVNRDRFLPQIQQGEALIVTQDDGDDEPIDM